MALTPHRTRGRTAAFALAAAAVLLATGCVAEKQDAGTNASPPPAPNTAPGVTDTAIKIGITYPDLAAVRQFVNIDHGNYEVVYNALITKINNDGGINGRRIIPVYGKVNVISPAAAQETCVHLTRDEKVFAVLGNLNADEPLCYAQTHRTAVIGGQLTAERYAKAQAPWFAYLRGGDELTDGLALVAGNNALAGRKVAVIAGIGEQAVLEGTVVPALRKLGVTPVQTGILDASPQDPVAVGQQAGVFIQKFQAADADTVVVVGSIAPLFAGTLERTKYRPRLVFTDNLLANSYVKDKGKHDFSTLTGASALGLSDQWGEAGNQACVTTAEKASSALRGKLADPATVPAGAPTPGVSLVTACQSLTLFTAIAEKAGRNLSYASFQDAGFALGELQVPGIGDKATYAKDTPHGDIPARLFTYDAAKHAFVTADG